MRQQVAIYRLKSTIQNEVEIYMCDIVSMFMKEQVLLFWEVVNNKWNICFERTRVSQTLNNDLHVC